RNLPAPVLQGERVARTGAGAITATSRTSHIGRVPSGAAAAFARFPSCVLSSAIRMILRRNPLVNTTLAVCQVLLLVPILGFTAASATTASEIQNPQEPQAKKPEAKGRASAMLKYRGEPVYIVANQFEQKGNTYMLHGEAQIDFRDYVLYADEISYNQDTGESTATGHVRLVGGDYNINMQATHAEYSVVEGTGKFYDVHGTTGLKLGSRKAMLTTS